MNLKFNQNISDFWNDIYTSSELICFGAGQLAKDILNNPFTNVLHNYINCFIDNNSNKVGTKLVVSNKEYSIYGPEYLYTETQLSKVVLITCNAYLDVIKQLQELYLQDNVTCYVYFTIKRYIEAAAPFKHQLYEQRRILLLNTPEHTNLGDHAIALCEIEFLRKCTLKSIIDITRDFYRNYNYELFDIIREEDIIFITGGGYLGTTWMYEEETVRRIITDFPNNKIIIFPQTIFFNDDSTGQKELIKSKSIYNTHNNLTVCARDAVSYEVFLTMNLNPCNLYLIPDMVLLGMEVSKSLDRKGIMLCLKEDKESIIQDTEKQKIEMSARKYDEMVTYTNTLAEKRLQPEERREHVDLKLAEFQGVRLVITDRLHGMIFAAITGTPCIAVNSFNHKMWATYEWLKCLKYIRFAYSLEELEELIPVMLHMENNTFDGELFEEYFEQLKNIVQKVTQ